MHRGHNVNIIPNLKSIHLWQKGPDFTVLETILRHIEGNANFYTDSVEMAKSTEILTIPGLENLQPRVNMIRTNSITLELPSAAR